MTFWRNVYCICPHTLCMLTWLSVNHHLCTCTQLPGAHHPSAALAELGDTLIVFAPLFGIAPDSPAIEPPDGGLRSQQAKHASSLPRTESIGFSKRTLACLGGPHPWQFANDQHVPVSRCFNQ